MLTTTELADELVGGILSAGPDRLEAAGASGLPQVIAPGALDMVNFGPPDTVPEKFSDRLFYQHNPTVTLMRTTAEETAELGRIMARKLSEAQGPTTVIIPTQGVSAIDQTDQPFDSPEARTAWTRESEGTYRRQRLQLLRWTLTSMTMSLRQNLLKHCWRR